VLDALSRAVRCTHGEGIASLINRFSLGIRSSLLVRIRQRVKSMRSPALSAVFTHTLQGLRSKRPPSPNFVASCGVPTSSYPIY
jgi:hypothetical protein